MKCSSSICIRERVTSGKIPARVPIKSPAFGTASHCRTWEIWSCKNLMKVHIGCRSIRSMCWTVKKAPTWIKVMYNKSGVIVVILKSSFLPERILRGYCRGDRLNSIYLCICWAGSPI